MFLRDKNFSMKLYLIYVGLIAKILSVLLKEGLAHEPQGFIKIALEVLYFWGI